MASSLSIRKWKPNAVLIPVITNDSSTTSRDSSSSYKPFSFLLTDCPPSSSPTQKVADGDNNANVEQDSSSTLDIFIETLNSHDCRHVMRLCEPDQYPTSRLQDVNITVHDWFFEDGTSPPQDIIQQFRSVILSEISIKEESIHERTSRIQSSSPIVFAIHCISGIGRAPALIACALIDFARMDPLDAITFIRSRRRGAINKQQLAWLTDSKRGFKPLTRAESTNLLTGRANSTASIKTGFFSKRSSQLGSFGSGSVGKNQRKLSQVDEVKTSISNPSSPLKSKELDGGDTDSLTSSKRKPALLSGWFSRKSSSLK